MKTSHTIALICNISVNRPSSGIIYIFVRINDKNTHVGKWQQMSDLVLCFWTSFAPVKKQIENENMYNMWQIMYLTQSSACMYPATCAACLHARSEGLREDHLWEVACRAAGSLPHPVPRATTGADPTEDPETCVICRWFWTPWGTSRGAAGPAGGSGPGSEHRIPSRPGWQDQSWGYCIW